MTRLLTSVVCRLIVWWTRLYTVGASEDQRSRRRAEVTSDLHEHVAARGDQPGLRIVLEIVGRWIRGIPSDIAWRTGLGAPSPDGSAEWFRFNGLGRDARHALAAVASRPGYAALMIFMLGAAIAANTAVFSVVDAVLLRSLPYREPGDLALIRNDFQGLTDHPTISNAQLTDLRSRSTTLQSVAAVSDGFDVLIEDGPDVTPARAVTSTANLAETLGVEPVIGRYFTPEEELRGRTAVAVISHRLWLQRYQGKPSVLDESLRLVGFTNELPIVGVLPADFRFLLGPVTNVAPDTEVIIPGIVSEDRSSEYLRSIVRLADGMTWAQAQAEVDAIARALNEEYPEEYQTAPFRLRLHRLHNDLVQDVSGMILALVVAVGLVLLTACTNAAGMQLTRNNARRSEIATRTALGAAPAGIVRLLTLEGIFLATLAGAVGVVGASGLTRLFVSVAPEALPRLDEVRIDWLVAAFAVGASGLTVLLSGLVPAVWVARRTANLQVASGRTHTLGVSTRLVVGQMVMAISLLVAGVLLHRSEANLRQTDLGFNPSAVVSLRATIGGYDLDEPLDRFRRFVRLRDAISSLPVVEGVGGVNKLPFDGRTDAREYAYDAATAASWGDQLADARSVVPGYFRAMGMDITKGRPFSDADVERYLHPDTTKSNLVVIVDEQLAQVAWGGGDPIGQNIRVQSWRGPEPATVVGTVRTPKVVSLRGANRPQIYFPYAGRRDMGIVVRGGGDQVALQRAIQQIVRSTMPGQPLYDFVSMAATIDGVLQGPAFASALMGTLALLAVGLALFGVYATVSLIVVQQRRDQAIRAALGATPSAIMRRHVTLGVRLAAIASPLGVLGAVGLSFVMRSQLFGVTAIDVPVLLFASLFVCLASGVAATFPAWKAARLDLTPILREG